MRKNFKKLNTRKNIQAGKNTVTKKDKNTNEFINKKNSPNYFLISKTRKPSPITKTKKKRYSQTRHLMVNEIGKMGTSHEIYRI